jgi:hypothetical protein
MSRNKVREIVNFLVEAGLCTEVDGKIGVGLVNTYLEPTSVFANNHRRNWRLKSMEKMKEPGTNDLFFTAPFSASKEDIKIIKQEMLEVIEKTFKKRLAESPAEKVACLVIDYFEF